jgi:hypothetical protein
MTHFSISDTRSDAEARRSAYNAAFHELGLNWFWDADCDQPDAADERECVRGYLAQHRPHLLTAYDADFLVDAILAAKARCASQWAAAGTGAATVTDWRALQQHQIGV